MSQFTETMFKNAQWSMKGMVTGEPRPVPSRHAREKCLFAPVAGLVPHRALAVSDGAER